MWNMNDIFNIVKEFYIRQFSIFFIFCLLFIRWTYTDFKVFTNNINKTLNKNWVIKNEVKLWNYFKKSSKIPVKIFDLLYRYWYHYSKGRASELNFPESKSKTKWCIFQFFSSRIYFIWHLYCNNFMAVKMFRDFILLFRFIIVEIKNIYLLHYY